MQHLKKSFSKQNNRSVVYENGQKVLHTQVSRALHGMLPTSLMFHKKRRNDLESIGFKFNDYDPCVANRMVKGK